MLTKALAIFIKSYVGLVFWLSISVPTSLSVQMPSREYRNFSRQEEWVDSVFNSLSNREKIGQLFAIRAHSNWEEGKNLAVEKLVKEYKVGGLCFFQGGPYRQAILTNRYQKLAKVPLLISIDGEWGLGMRLDTTISFPRQMTLGAIQNDSLIYQMGKEIAYQFRRVGIHINYAPSVDVNNNPNNPVIGDRSFGEDKENVARKGIMYVRGMQDNGLMASAKHFPGHGDTDVDSHYGLPVINHPKTRLNDLELYPFKQLIINEVQSVMVAHLKVTNYDSTMITTLSPKVIGKLLQTDLNFKGLVFTDALEMKGVANYYPFGEMDVLALIAGVDMLLLSGDVIKAIESIEQAILQKRLSWEDINQKVKKILRAKYRAGLNQYKPVDLNNLGKDLNSFKAYQIQETLYQKALTLVKNNHNFLPISRLDTNTFASVALGEDKKNVFQENLDNYASFEHYQIPKTAIKLNYDQVFNQVKTKKVVVLSLHNMNKSNVTNFNILPLELEFIKNLQKRTKLIINVFGSPYSLRLFNESAYLTCAYQDNAITQKLLPQLLFGAIAAEGKLPVTASPQIPLYTGLNTKALARLRYGTPEEVGLNGDTLKLIDQEIQKAIKDTAMPGCQVLVARAGKVVYYKTFGHQTYNSQSLAIDKNTIYDVASISKVAGTLQVIMYLYDQGKLDLDKKASDYLAELKGTNKENMTLREVLTHQAGLIAYQKHWEKTLLPNKTLNPQYYSKVKTSKYSLPIAEGIYGLNSLQDSLWKWSIISPLAKSKDSASNFQYYKYEYSDLSFYTMKKVAERILKEPIEKFLLRELYQPLGLTNTTYNPLEKFKKEQIAPTERDTMFRQQILQGYVHDQGAAMLGGVAGHAGLFSNAKDLAIVMQMLLQKGTYGGKQYYKPETVKLFTQKQYPLNRRGLGWDKPDKILISYIPEKASAESFGHSGFTGCAVWIDPQSDMVVVFLSNRVHPRAENDKLVKGHIRRKVFDIAYRAISK